MDKVRWRVIQHALTRAFAQLVWTGSPRQRKQADEVGTYVAGVCERELLARLSRPARAVP